MSMGCPNFVIDDDDLDTASKISSEDSGEVPSFTEDSDESYELETDSQAPGQMNLLEEILDTLSTTSAEQGKLSAAKSLDFFRSFDELDYKNTTKCNPPRDGDPSQPPGEQMSWNMGQDDSALHGKHLPPSPRRQSVKAPPDTLRAVADGNDADPPHLPRNGDSPGERPPRVPQAQPASATTNTLRRRVLSKRPNQQDRPRQPSMLVPWENQNSRAGDGEAGGDEQDLLGEIESVYRLSSAIDAGLQLSEVSGGGADES